MTPTTNIEIITEQIKEAVNIKKPLIWLYTTEEKEVEALIYNALADISQCDSIYTTSLSSPIAEIITKQNIVSYSTEEDLGYGFDAMISIINENIEEDMDDSCFIFKDYHQVLSNPTYIRKLKDVSMTNLISYRPIFIISPSKDIPIELLNKTTIIDYTLPTVVDIISLLEMYDAKIQSLNLEKEEIEYLASKLICFTRQEIIDILNTSMYRYKAIDLDIIKEFKTKLIQQTGVLDIEDTTNSTIESLGGNDNFKQWIQELQYLNTQEAKDFGVVPPKGHLCLGPPGTSKTASTKVVANLLDVPMLKLNTSKIFSKHVGSSERNIEKAFEIISSYAPCLLLIDEVEKVLSGVSSSESDGGTSSRVFARVLEFLNNDNGIYVVMTANDVSKLPPELTRAGRLDSIWFFGLPTLEERKHIFNIHLNKLNIDYTLSNSVLELTEGYTGAEIEQITKIAKRKHFVSLIGSANMSNFKDEYIVEAVNEVIPVSKSSKEKINALEMWARNRVLYASNCKSPKLNKNKFILE